MGKKITEEERLKFLNNVQSNKSFKCCSNQKLDAFPDVFEMVVASDRTENVEIEKSVPVYVAFCVNCGLSHQYLAQLQNLK